MIFSNNYLICGRSLLLLPFAASFFPSLYVLCFDSKKKTKFTDDLTDNILFVWIGCVLSSLDQLHNDESPFIECTHRRNI